MTETPVLINDAPRRLNCLIESDYIIFEVTVGNNCTVSNLKEVIQRTRRLDMLKDIDPQILELWKVNIDLKPHDEGSLPHLKLEQNSESVEKLKPSDSIGKYWSCQPPINHLHIIVKVPTAFRKHSHSSPAEDDDHEAKKQEVRQWTVGEAIRGTDMSGCYYVDPGVQDESTECLNALLRHQLVLLAGARASGKTTRLFWLKRELQVKGYPVIYLSFEHVSVSGVNVQTFWNTFGLAVQAAASIGPFAVSKDFTPLSSVGEFLFFFRVSAWKRSVVLIIDEFSNLCHADSTILDECLRALREIRNNHEQYAIHGTIAAGTSGILSLTPTFKTSPFNVADHVKNPYFSIDETRKLFLEFAHDNLITIDDDVIKDVWLKSNGHPGMVCLCGRAISENFHHMVAFPDRVLSYKSWQTFSALHMHHRAHEYLPFRSMIESLLKEEAAVDFLRSRFVGFLGAVSFQDVQQVLQANFLAAEGLLFQSGPYDYHVASAFVDGLIRKYLIPKKFPNAPLTPPPIASDGRPHVLEVLTQSLRFFDKDLIRLAATRSLAYKQSKVNVGGLRAVGVPRESVYDTELMRILVNWLGKQKAYAINGQWHLQTDEKNKYCDIVISKPTTPTVILELLATGDASLVRARIEKAPYYKDLLSADEIWVVHFTCEDDYLDNPTWQSDEQLQREGINVVHFWHDLGFSTVSMSARWKDADGNIQEVNNQPIAL